MMEKLELFCLNIYDFKSSAKSIGGIKQFARRPRDVAASAIVGGSNLAATSGLLELAAGSRADAGSRDALQLAGNRDSGSFWMGGMASSVVGSTAAAAASWGPGLTPEP